MKTVLFVAVAAGVGVVVGDMISDSQIGKKLQGDSPNQAKAVRTGIAAGTAGVTFGVLNSIF